MTANNCANNCVVLYPTPVPLVPRCGAAAMSQKRDWPFDQDGPHYDPWDGHVLSKKEMEIMAKTHEHYFRPCMDRILKKRKSSNDNGAVEGAASGSMVTVDGPVHSGISESGLAKIQRAHDLWMISREELAATKKRAIYARQKANETALYVNAKLRQLGLPIDAKSNDGVGGGADDDADGNAGGDADDGSDSDSDDEDGEGGEGGEGGEASA